MTKIKNSSTDLVRKLEGKEKFGDVFLKMHRIL
jgi:hypothetical protein